MEKNTQQQYVRNKGFGCVRANTPSFKEVP
jgi:hypothetical protein